MIYRAFGGADALSTARAIRRVAYRRGLVFLVGADAALAHAVKADGVHLPERFMQRAPALKRSHPAWRITAHDRKALWRADRLRLDAALVSTVFESRSQSAATPLGPVRFAGLIRGAGLRVIALGGINKETAARLIDTGAHGMAAVDGLTPLEG